MSWNRAGSLLRLLVCLGALAATPARAEVDDAHLVIEETAQTLHRYEVKLGLLESAVGLTERLQLQSQLFLTLLSYVNLGAKYQLVAAPNFSLAVEGWGGGVGIALLGGTAMFHVGTQLLSSFRLTETLKLHPLIGIRYWRLAPLPGTEAGSLLFNGRIAWPTAKAALEWDVTPNHILWLTAGTPASWLAASERTSHAFDATSFWSLLVGYQVSWKWLNARLDLGYGAGLLGRGLTGSLDVYVRFNGPPDPADDSTPTTR